MELVNGDSTSPTLISNVEVMELLKKNIGERAKANNQNKKKNKKRADMRFRHRDWVEGEVYKYLQSTPCVKLDPSKREEFHSKLKGNKKLRRSVASSGKKGEGDQKQPSKESEATGFDLTEAEALQIMNMMPAQPVEIHLMVDDLQSRMSEERQEEFLGFVASYCTGAEPSPQPMEEDEVAPQINGKHDNHNRGGLKIKQESTEERGVI